MTPDAPAEVSALDTAKVRLHYRLADLVATCDFDAPEPVELAEWNAIQPVGREVLDGLDSTGQIVCD
nr:AbrB family transcriptional regulator [Pseudomonas avellanae]